MNENVEQVKNVKREERNDLSTFAWAFVLLWAGLIFLAENLGYFQRWITTIRLPENAHALSAWTVVFIGAGLIFFIEAILHIILPGERKHFTGALVMAAVGFGIGLGQVFSWSLIGPFILIAIGISFLLRGLFSR